MDLSVNIAIGSSAQVALFVAPVLVLLSFVVGEHPMALVFNGFELAAVLLAIFVANFVVNEGESTWFEGLQLLALYAVFGVVFYYVCAWRSCGRCPSSSCRLSCGWSCPSSCAGVSRGCA